VLLHQGLAGGQLSAPVTAVEIDPSERAPTAAAASDLDGDGDLDIVVTSNGLPGEPGNVHALFNDGGGRFTPQPPREVGPQVGGVAVADLDDDGDPDVAFTHRGEGASIRVGLLLNDGAGGLAGAGDFATRLVDEAGRSAITAGDLDGDSDLDLAVAEGLGSRVEVLRNDGAGAFQPGDLVATGLFPEAILAVDLDADGALELVTANAGSDDVAVLRRFGGDGPFSPALLIGTGAAPSAIAAGDIDGDGALDLVTANREALRDGRRSLVKTAESLSVLFGEGDGGLREAFSVTEQDNPAAELISLADFNDDGVLDLAVASFGGELDLFLSAP
jgi:hypothetical protein